MKCPVCSFGVKQGSRQCESCGTIFETSLTDDMYSSKGSTGHLEYAFLSQSAQPALPNRPNGVAVPPPSIRKDITNGRVVAPPAPTTENPLTENLPQTSVVAGLCRSCQAELRPGMRFCSSCGTSVAPSPLIRTWKTLQQKAQASWKQAYGWLGKSSLPGAAWIALGLAGCCILCSFTTLFLSTRSISPASDQTHLIAHLRSIEWLLLAILAALGGLYVRNSKP